jgi:catechol-2,3-dioxygenase
MGASSPEIELQCEPIKNRKMKTRCFDHIDLSVKNIAVAGRFYAKFLPQLGFVEERPGKKYHMFYSAGGDNHQNFLVLRETRIISQIVRGSHSGQIHEKK